MNDMGCIEKRKKCILDELFPKYLLMLSVMCEGGKKNNACDECLRT